jgi:hypothetical protein
LSIHQALKCIFLINDYATKKYFISPGKLYSQRKICAPSMWAAICGDRGIRGNITTRQDSVDITGLI